MTRGTWKGSGTWETTSGLGARAAFVIAAAVAVLALLEWLAARIWWVLTGTIVLAAVGAVGYVALLRWARRREDRHATGRSFLVAREVTGAPLRQLAGAGRPAISGDVHIHLHGVPDAEQAAVIRTALLADDGDAVELGRQLAAGQPPVLPAITPEGD